MKDVINYFELNNDGIRYIFLHAFIYSHKTSVKEIKELIFLLEQLVFTEIVKSLTPIKISKMDYITIRGILMKIVKEKMKESLKKA